MSRLAEVEGQVEVPVMPIVKTRALRLAIDAGEPDKIAIGFEVADPGGQQAFSFFELPDTVAYSFIRQMTSVLFEA